MAETQPACLIATGGTAGHVLPSLAVADALRARGVRVTFAGSPGRFEAKLVPEAGFDFDAFEITGLPRRPGIAQIKAVAASSGGVGRTSCWAAEAIRRGRWCSPQPGSEFRRR
jgi:UDP-N-acetylglucosamine:LPS N-acetylglucosamine transferase